MSTTITPTSFDHRWYTVHHPAEKAYAAGAAVVAFGLLAVALGVRSFAFGQWIEGLFGLAFLVGAAFERSVGTAVGVFVAVAIANYAIFTSTHDRAYSHTTLAFQFLAVIAVVLLVGSAAPAFRRGMRAGRNGR